MANDTNISAMITEVDLQHALLRWKVMHDDGNIPTFEQLRESGYDTVGATQVMAETLFGIIWEAKNA